MATLNKDVFGLTVENHELVKLAYDAYLANSRSSHAKTFKAFSSTPSFVYEKC